MDRQAPLDEPTRGFLASYLADLLESTRDRLPDLAAEQSRRYLDPDSDDFLLNWPDLAFSVLEHVVWGQVGSR